MALKESIRCLLKTKPKPSIGQSSNPSNSMFIQGRVIKALNRPRIDTKGEKGGKFITQWGIPSYMYKGRRRPGIVSGSG